MFSFFCLFSVGMAAVREVSLCQVPVGLTPVFEADKHRGVWEVHFHTPTRAQEHVHTHTHILVVRYGEGGLARKC